MIMAKKYKYRVAWCAVCNQGWVEIAKDKNSKELFCYCNECESEWANPQDLKNPAASTQGLYGTIEEPSETDIDLKGWRNFILED